MKTTIELIDALEGQAHESLTHVAIANYNEREAYARNLIRKVAEDCRAKALDLKELWSAARKRDRDGEPIFESLDEYIKSLES